ncbi:putative heat shock protein 70 family protein [Tanacetum coccineum]
MWGSGKDATAIGIDLGTTYSCVGVWKHERVEIITNDQGNRTTPSTVAFLDSVRLVGDGAKNQAAMNPLNTIFDAKRLIGRKFSDSKVQENMKLWPFKVIQGHGNTPKIAVFHKGQEKEFLAEEISSMILGKMKETAEAYLGKVVKNAVITVPAYFNDSQRQATKDASAIAGLNLCKSVNPDEAVAYGAAAMGAKLSGNSDKHVRDLCLLDVTPLSLGVGLVGNIFSVVIPRNTSIPTKKANLYWTIYDNQTSVNINVYQGERAQSSDNHFLGTFTISGIPHGPKGVPKLEECFEIDANGILTVTAKILSTDAEKYKLEDQEYKKKVHAQNALEDYLYDVGNKMNELTIKKRVHPESLKKMEKAVADTTEWLQVNDTASVDELQRKKFGDNLMDAKTSIPICY